MRHSIGSSRRAAGAVLALGSFVAHGARADVAACVQWHANGQREANAGHLKLASEQFASCAGNEKCPAAIRDECVELYDRVEKNLPTVIFSAVDSSGKDVVSARVYADERVVSEALDGHAIGIDPGNYEFKFVLPSGESVSASAQIREAEKNRLVAVRLPAAESQDEPGGGRGQRLPPTFFVASGVGAVGLASFGLFALLGNGQKSKLSSCSPGCGEPLRSNFDAMRRDYLIADISLGVAAASAGVATWLYFSSRSAQKSERATAFGKVTVAPLVSATALGVVVDATTF